MKFDQPTPEALKAKTLDQLYTDWAHAEKRLKFWSHPGRAVFPNCAEHLKGYTTAIALYYNEITARAEDCPKVPTLLLLIETGSLFTINKPNLQ